METTVTTRLKLASNTYDNWIEADPVLKYGEPSVDMSNNMLKVGDGESKYSALSYLTSDRIGNDSIGSDQYPIYLYKGSPQQCNRSIPKYVSDLTNDKGYITSDTASSTYVKATDLESKLANVFVGVELEGNTLKFTRFSGDVVEITLP